MKRLDRIVAVVDPTSDVQPALAKAARLASASNASLELFVCDHEPALDNPRFFHSERLRVLREEFLASRKAMLERHAAPLRGQGLSVTTEARWAKPVHDAIVTRVRECAPDLVVKDTHYHGPIRRTVITNTDWNLIRTCPAPLLLAKPEDWRRQPRILAAVDPGHEDDPLAALDDELLELGSRIANLLSGELHVVHAFFPAEIIASTSALAVGGAIDGGTVVELLEAERGRIREALAGLARRHAVLRERIQFRQGVAVEVLCDVAVELPADVVVLGAIARGRIRDLIIGSTAERVLDRIVCDILVAKPAGAGLQHS